MAKNTAKTKKITIDKKYLWDYELPNNWQPKTKGEWLWLLERKINYDDWRGITKEILKKYFPGLKKQIDPGRKMIIDAYLEKYA